MRKAKAIFKHPRVILLIIILLLAILAIYPALGRQGVVIQSVTKEGPAYNQGIIIKPTAKPMSREVIKYIDRTPIKTLEDYYNYVSKLGSNMTIRIETNKNVYRIITNENSSLGLEVAQAPMSNIRKGLDLQGGTRVFLQPEEEVEPLLLEEATSSLKLRLNTYGLSDVVVKKVESPEQFIIVEVAGATQSEVKDLISRQGKFEANIGNYTVFSGGDDIKFVGLGAQEARVEQCSPIGNGNYNCRFVFSLTISQEAADRFADATKDLEIVPGEGSEDKLSEPLVLVLDDEPISNLSIVASLKGKSITNPSVTGGASGRTQKEAYDNALRQMQTLQTILETGSLPIKLEIAESLTLSPVLGKEFTKNVFKVGILAILAVTIVIFIVYRKLKIAIPMFITMACEVLILLGLAGAINWQLDLAAIAGIIIAAGTGVDDQIVITSEVLRGETAAAYNWKQKIKRAFFIIFAAYITTVVAVIPLGWAGAGLLKGFAFATIAGVSIGVFITRPAFAAIIEGLLKD